MPVKQVKLNLKPEIYKPLAQEAKRLRMPIASLVRVILADAILPDQEDENVSQLDEILELPIEDLSDSVHEFETDTQESQIGTGAHEADAGVNNNQLLEVARSLSESANTLAATTRVLADSVRELTQFSRIGSQAQSVVNQPVTNRPAINRPVNQPRVDKDGELVLKLSDLLGEQGSRMGSSAVGDTTESIIGGSEAVLGNTAERSVPGVIVEDLDTPTESIQPDQANQTAQKLRKITINLV